MARKIPAVPAVKSVSVLLIAVLLLLTGVLWFVSTLVADPPAAVDGRARTEGYSHVSSLYGSGADRLHRPTEVTTDRSGNIYVADSFKHRIIVFNNDGRFIRTIGSPANVDGALKYPSSVKVDDRGRVYVTSSEPDRVVVFDAQGKPVKSFDVPRPLTLAIKGDRLYVATAEGILIGDLDGNQVGQLLSKGSKPGQIDRPTGMVIADDGTIYLADSLNYRFQALTPKGEVKWVLGKQPTGENKVVDKTRQFGLPAGLTMGGDGVLYGVDAFNGEIIAIGPDGAELGTYGDWGRKDGQFYYPGGITQVGSERFAIADTFNDRVQIVTIPSPKPNAAIAARRGLPLIVPVLLLIPAIFLLRRPVAVVADAVGIRRAQRKGLIGELVHSSKAIYVPEGTAERVASIIAEDERLMDVLQEVELDELAEGADAALELGVALRGRFGLRRVAIAFPSQSQSDAAAEHGIGVLGEAAPDAAAAPAVG